MENSVDKKLLDFFSKGSELRYERGQIILNAGDEPSGIYYISSGYVKMNSISKNGSVLTLNIFKPGSFFPMMWALGEVDNAFFYQTMTNIEAYRVSKEKVLKFIKEDPEVLYNLTKRIFIGMEGLLSNLQHLLYGNSYDRVVSAVLISAKRFGKGFKNNSVLIDLRLTHQDIANLAGISRETASIALGKLKNNKIITYTNRKIIVRNLKNLEKETSTTNS